MLMLALLGHVSLFLTTSSLECTKLRNGRKNEFTDRGKGRLVTYVIRTIGIGTTSQNLGMLFFLSPRGEPFYGSEITVIPSLEDGGSHTLRVRHQHVERRSTTPCDNWPQGMFCDSDKDTAADVCTVEFKEDVFQDFEFVEIGNFFQMSMNGVPVGRVRIPDADCLARGGNHVENISYQGAGASHLFSCN